MHLGAEDLNFGVFVFLKTLGEDEIDICNVLVPQFRQIGIVIDIPDESQFQRGGDNDRVSARLLVSPTVFSLPVHLKAVDIMLHGGDFISSPDQFRDEFFDQSGFSAARFSHNRDDGNHKNLLRLGSIIRTPSNPCPASLQAEGCAGEG